MRFFGHSSVAQVNMYCSKSGVILMLVGNKIDKGTDREVSHQVTRQQIRHAAYTSQCTELHATHTTTT